MGSLPGGIDLSDPGERSWETEIAEEDASRRRRRIARSAGIAAGDRLRNANPLHYSEMDLFAPPQKVGAAPQDQTDEVDPQGYPGATNEMLESDVASPDDNPGDGYDAQSDEYRCPSPVYTPALKDDDELSSSHIGPGDSPAYSFEHWLAPSEDQIEALAVPFQNWFSRSPDPMEEGETTHRYSIPDEEQRLRWGSTNGEDPARPTGLLEGEASSLTVKIPFEILQRIPEQPPGNSNPDAMEASYNSSDLTTEQDATVNPGIGASIIDNENVG